MSIRVECVSCNKKIVVHDRFEGRNVRCPSCNFEMRVPKRSEMAEKPSDVANVDPQIEDAPKPSSRSSKKPAKPTATDWVEPLDEPEPVVESKPEKNRRSRSIRNDHGKEEEDLEWDITPMVDVAFLLLIFFMLTASFSIQKVIRTTPPQSDQPSTNAVQVQSEDKVDSVVVQVDEFNAYTVVSDGQTNEASSKQELIAILRDIRAQAGEQLPRIVIQAHVDSFHGATVGCMDAAREAEFTSFQIFAVESFD